MVATEPSRDRTGIAAGLVAPVLAHDLEYERGKAAVAAALFDEPFEAPTVARYTLLRRLGAGGMGEVYAARDPVLGREVAIKLARTRGRDDAGDSRLLREAQLLARLSHANVVHVYEVGTVGAHVYIAMELIRGRTLRAWQNERPRRWSATLRIYLAAARGLAAAHAAGLVHCDFKPDNVLVDERDHAVVVDFGLARTAERARGDDPASSPGPSSRYEHSTAPGPAAGTPGYIAPEQLAGRPPDRRSDIYSVCVSLFEALHGHLPVRGAAVDAAARVAAPRWVTRALARGMDPDPERRYPSLEALIAALDRDPARARRRVALGGALLALGGVAGALVPRDSPVPEDRCSVVERGIDSVWNQGRRAALAAAFRGADVGFAHATWQRVDAGIGAYVAAWRTGRRLACASGRPRSSQSSDPRTACFERSAYALDALLDRLLTGDRSAIEQSVSAVDALPRLELCGDAPAHTGPPPSPERAGLVEALRRSLLAARAHASTGDARQALRLAEQALARARDVDAPSIRADALLTVGELQADGGELSAAEERLFAAVDIAEAARLDDLAAAGWIHLTTLAARQQVAPERAQLWGRRATASLDRIGDQGPRRAALLDALGIAAAHAGRYAEAARLHREAVARLVARGGSGLELVRSLQSLANALEQLSRRDEALAIFEEALARTAAQFGPRHPRFARISHDMASLLIAAGDHARARSLLEGALAIWIDAHGEYSIESGRTHTSLAHQAVQAGELGRAEAHARRALAIYRRVLPQGHEDLAAALVNLGVIAFSRGDHDGAIAFNREALALQVSTLPEGHLHRAITASNIGESLVALGRHAEALAMFAVAEPIARAAPTSPDELLALLLKGKGEALAALKRTRPAVAALAEARVLASRLPGWSDQLAAIDATLARLKGELDAREK